MKNSIGWRIRRNEGQYYIEKGDIKATMDTLYIRKLFNRWGAYVTDYSPPPNYKPKRILDIGCGQGETMIFFNVMTGCKDFIGVDLNEKTRHYLEINSKLNDWKVKIHNEPFKPEHMATECDYIKIDVEGAESCLIDHEFNIPTVMEAHSEDLMRLFQNKGFQTTRIVNKSRNVVIMNNFNHLGLREPS
jgi:ribosomal protein L11 methylase PrmA